MYYLLSFIIKALSYIPFWLLYILSDGLYYIVYYVVKYRRRLVRKNLTESFPEKSEQEIIKIEKKFYHYFISRGAFCQYPESAKILKKHICEDSFFLSFS